MGSESRARSFLLFVFRVISNACILPAAWYALHDEKSSVSISFSLIAMSLRYAAKDEEDRCGK